MGKYDRPGNIQEKIAKISAAISKVAKTAVPKKTN
jgi:hypothetical protein